MSSVSRARWANLHPRSTLTPRHGLRTPPISALSLQHPPDATMGSSVPPDAPKPRLCHVKKWSDFNGYGFNLHAEKGRHGHHIGAVDAASPADAAGLKEGDRIVEVNGTNIANENHQQVVSRIKAVQDEVTMLVVDAATDEYYREKRVVVRGDMGGVQAITTPTTQAEYKADPMAGYHQVETVTTGGCFAEFGL